MNPYKKFQSYVIGGFLEDSVNIFDRARAKALFDFLIFITVLTVPFQIQLLSDGYVVQFWINMVEMLAVPFIIMFLRGERELRKAGVLVCYNADRQLYGPQLCVQFHSIHTRKCVDLHRCAYGLLYFRDQSRCDCRMCMGIFLYLDPVLIYRPIMLSFRKYLIVHWAFRSPGTFYCSLSRLTFICSG